MLFQPHIHNINITKYNLFKNAINITSYKNLICYIENTLKVHILSLYISFIRKYLVRIRTKNDLMTVGLFKKIKTI